MGLELVFQRAAATGTLCQWITIPFLDFPGAVRIMTEVEKTEQMLAEFCTHQNMLKGYIFSAIRDYHAAEDMLQEIAILITKKAATFDFDRPVAPWLTGVAKIHIRRWFQQSGRRPLHISFEMLDQCLTDHEGFEAAAMLQRESLLVACVESLPSKQRRIMRLRYAEGLNCERISQMTSRSVQSIYSTIKRLKKSLRECVNARQEKDGE